MGFVPGPTDPFYELMQPPADETPAQKTARLKREFDAQRVSDSIDEDIKQERARQKKEKKVVKVLLLGQAESGESQPMDAIGVTLIHYIFRKIHNAQKYGFSSHLHSFNAHFVF